MTEARVVALRSFTAAAVLALTACGGDGASDADVQRAVADALASQSAAAQPTAQPVVESPAAPVTEPAPSATSVILSFTMPNFVGVNLQDAQDQVQELGIFFSRSHDLLGTRSQVLDGNWQVCDQVPAAGTPVQGEASALEGTIDFGAVKLSESCP